MSGSQPGIRKEKRLRHDIQIPSLIKKRHPFVAAFVNRPVTILVIVIAALLIGFIALTRMDVAMLPPGLETRTLRISVPLRDDDANWSAKEVEKRISLPIEGELSTIPGIKELMVNSQSDEAEFFLEFDGNTDLDEVYPQVRDKIERVKAQIGELIGHVRYRREGMSGMAIAFVGIGWKDHVEFPFDKLSTKVIPAIESSPGISRVQLWGDVNLYYRVALDRGKLANYPDISVRDLVSTLQADNTSAPAGKVDADGKESFVVVDSRFESLDQLKNYPISQNLKLSDVATIEEAASSGSAVYTYSWDDEDGTFIGTRGVYCPVYKTSDVNDVKASDALKQVIEELENDPTLEGFRFRMGFNRGDMIIEQLETLATSLAFGFVLAMLVLIVFLKRLVLALIIALSVPLAMLLAAIVMFFSGEVLSMISLMGFTVAAGMLLDNAIVVSENIYRRFSIDDSPYAASVLGAGEVGLAISLATLTTAVVFLSMLFGSENEMASFFVTRLSYPIVGSLAFSVFVAIVVIPHVVGRTYGSFSRKPNVVQRANSRVLGFITTVLVGVGEWIDSRKRPWVVYLSATLISAGVASLISWLIFTSLGGEDLISPLTDKILGLEEDEGMGRWAAMMGGASDKSEPHYISLVTLTVFVLGSALLPLLLLVLPRSEQKDEASPIIARTTKVYASMIARLVDKAPVALGYLSLLLIGIVASFAIGSAGDLVKSSDSTANGSQDLRFFIQFPENIDAESSDIRDTINEESGETPPRWEYFFKVREELFGLPLPTESKSKRELDASVSKALEKYSLDSGSIVMRPSGMMLFLKVREEKAFETPKIRRQISKAMPEMAGFRASQGWGGSRGSNSIRIMISGKEFGKLEAIAADLLPQIRTLPMLTDVSDGNEENGRGEAILMLDRAKAQNYGVEAQVMARVIGFQLNGTVLSDFHRGDVTRPIRLVFEAPVGPDGKKRDPTLDDVRQVRIPGGSGGVNFDTVVTGPPQISRSSDSIQRHNRRTTLQISAKVEGSTEEAREAIESAISRLDIPAGYDAEVVSGFQRRRRRGGGVGGDIIDVESLLIGLCLVFLVMAKLFESFLRPIVVVLGCVPGALLGGYFGLAVTETELNPLCFIGLLILIGVSVNNGIVLVDLINQQRREGLELKSAVVTACEQRFRPMVMTAMTTVAGLIPMAIEPELITEINYAPLGKTVLYGLSIGTIVTLCVVPLLYVALEPATAFMRVLLAKMLPEPFRRFIVKWCR